MGVIRRALRWGIAARLPIGLALAWAYFFEWHPAYPNPNEVVRLYLTRAMVDDGTFAIDAPIRKFGDVEDKSQRNGRFYCDKAVGLSFLAVPIYAALKALGGEPSMASLRLAAWLFIVVLPGLILLVALRRYLARFIDDGRWRDAVVIAYALGTLAFTFSTLFFGHQPAAIFLAGAFIILHQIRAGERKRRAALLAGLLAGTAVFIEYTTVPVFVILGAYALFVVRWRVWMFAAPAILPAALVMIHNAAAFGGPFETGYTHHAVQQFQAIHETGFLGITTPKWAAFVGSFFEPARGLFFYSPFLLLALPGLFLIVRKRATRPEGLVLAAVLAFYVYFISSFGYWQSGGSVGPRHLTPLVPFLLPPVAVMVRALVAARSGMVRGVASAVVLAAIAVAVLTVTLTSIPWPYPAFGFSNPLAQVALLGWREGYVPQNVGSLFGASPALGSVGFLALVGVFMALLFHAPARAFARRHALAVSLSAALGASAVFSAYVGIDPRPEEVAGRTEHVLTRIVPLVDKDRVGFRAGRVANANARLTNGPDSASELVLGEWAASIGNWPEALNRYRRALQH